jgi:DNA polymerase-3 subunit epsilon
MDWSAHGFGAGRSVSALVTAAGYFGDVAHRAEPDAWSVACLLAMTAQDGRTMASHLLTIARRPTRKIFAVGAPFSVKEALKAAGYRWDASRGVWWLEADPERIANESLWLVDLCPAIRPKEEDVDWHSRHIT